MIEATVWIVALFVVVAFSLFVLYVLFNQVLLPILLVVLTGFNWVCERIWKPEKE